MNIRALQCPTSARLQELVLVSHGTALPGLLWSDITVRPGHRHPQTDATISHSTRLSTPAQESFNFNNFNQNHFFIYVCDLCALNFSNIFIDLLLHYQSYQTKSQSLREERPTQQVTILVKRRGHLKCSMSKRFKSQRQNSLFSPPSIHCRMLGRGSIRLGSS